MFIKAAWDWYHVITEESGPDLSMQLFKVGCEVVYPLRIQKLPDDVGRLQVAYCGNVLRHGRIVVMLGVQVVPVTALDLSYGTRIRLQFACARFLHNGCTN